MWRTACGLVVSSLALLSTHAALPLLVLASASGAGVLVLGAVVLISVLGSDKRREAALSTIKAILGRPDRPA